MIQLLGRIGRYVTLLILVLAAGTAVAQQRIGVAVVLDGTGDRLQYRFDVYVQELLALTESEFDVDVTTLQGDWTHNSIQRAIEQAYADPQVDLVLMGGFIGNQLADSGFQQA